MLGGVAYSTVLCYYPYLVSMLFADLLSLHLVTFLMFFPVILKPMTCLTMWLASPHSCVLWDAWLHAVISVLHIFGSLFLMTISNISKFKVPEQ